MHFHDEYESSLEPRYYLAASKIGASTSPQTANQITQMGNLLNQGMQNIEIGTISKDVFEHIPKQHFTEMRRLGKLTGANTSVHGPTDVDLAGFNRQGNYDHTEQLVAQRQVESMMERVHDLDPEGNTILNFHSGTLPVIEWQKEGLKRGEKRATGVVNRETGQLTKAAYEEKEYFGEKEPHVWTPEDRLRNLNATQWDNEKLSALRLNKEIFDISKDAGIIAKRIAHYDIGEKEGVLTEEERAQYAKELNKVNTFNEQIENLNSHLRTELHEMHNKFAKYTDKPLRDKYRENYKQTFQDVDQIGEEMETIAHKQEELSRKAGTRPTQEIVEKFNQLGERRSELLAKQHEQVLHLVGNMPAPRVWVDIDEFSINKVSDTVSNAVFNSFKKFGEKSPALLLENIYPEMPLSRADSLNKAIEEAKRKFTEKVVQEKHVSQESARRIADKLIGATWDLSHINMLKKFGYTDKDILEETKKIAPHLKHIHYVDNWGFSDSHLAPGMGNVPHKAMSKFLEEAAKGKDVKSIMEAGGYVAQFEQSPYADILAEMGSPLYSIKQPPYWNQIAHTYAPYSMGVGDVLTRGHIDIYGSGFSTMPRELGGQVGGERSRFAGTPNE